jgi:hypothetical protein
MSIQLYSRKEWERDPTRLPDLEVFYAGGTEDMESANNKTDTPLPRGWYWWSCTPGCLPDSEANGPFKTAATAKRDALDTMGAD